MASLNLVQIIGNLGRDPEMRYTASGQAVTQATVAVSRRFQKNGEWTETTEWFKLVLWGESGERLAEKMKKGQSIYAQGRLETRSWEDKEGAKRYSTELIVDRWQSLAPKSEREDGEERPTRREGSSGSRQQRGAPPEPTESTDDLSDLDDLPF